MSTQIAVAALLVDPDERILYQLRDDDPAIFQPNLWGLIGGAIEEGESPEDALYRELEEEIEYSPNNLTFFRYYNLPGKKGYIFVSRVNFSDPSILKLHEGQEVKFFSKDEVNSLCKNWKAASEIKRIISDYYDECEQRKSFDKI